MTDRETKRRLRREAEEDAVTRRERIREQIEAQIQRLNDTAPVDKTGGGKAKPRSGGKRASLKCNRKS